MKRIPLLCAALGLLGAAACGPAEVVVTAEIEATDPATGEPVTRQLSDLEVLLLPYDRDVIFDSLASAAAGPEPQVPAELLEAQDAVAQAQQSWRELETRWNTLRDTLQKISSTLDEYTRGESRYRLLYNEFQDMEAQYAQVERRKDRSFVVFDSLQRANIEQTQAFRLGYDEWADEAFADADAVMLARVRASGLAAVADTTDANGVVSFEVKPGEYWVHARYEEPYSELYWNVPLTVTRGEPLALGLNRSNAEQRPKF
jgi:hypothetical protein